MTVGVCLSVCVFFGKITGKVMNGLNKSVHTFTLLNESIIILLKRSVTGWCGTVFMLWDKGLKLINY